MKGKRDLWVIVAERDAMQRALTTCPSTRLPVPGSTPTVAELPRTANPPARRRPFPLRHGPKGVYYANCIAVRAAGAAPIMRGRTWPREGRRIVGASGLGRTGLAREDFMMISGHGMRPSDRK